MSHRIDRRSFVAGAASLAAGGMLPRMSHAAEVPPANYDEAKVPPYTLPDPLTFADGTKVADADAWRTKRRAELLSLFADHVYGRTPPSDEIKLSNTGIATIPDVLDGLADRAQTTLRLQRGDRSIAVHVLLYTPAKADKPVPTFLGLNFYGNHTICDDPAVKLAACWVANNKEFGITDNRATEESRNARAHRWPIRTILERGYGIATACYNDIDPDFHDGFKNGLHPLLDRFEGDRPDHAWGSIGAWACGMSDIRRLLETVPAVDKTRVIAFGHSRLGKTALWAGAQDEAFAMTISNNSGCGGAALNRRAYGETVARITTSFPHWFAGKYATYANNEAAMPIDQHELIALCAPRPVYVASAVEDRWADPRGEFLSCLHASPVYKLLGLEGLPAAHLPPVDQPVHGTIGYHLRRGKHDVTDYDWQQYLAFADKHLRPA
jgi:hypothetical protein